jgi:hypothetical protein
MDMLSSRVTPVDDSYPTCERTECTFAVYDLEPDLVTQLLCLGASRSQKKGIAKIMPNGTLHIPTISSWLLSSENQVASKDVRKHIDWLLDRIEPVSNQLQKLQQLPDTKMAIRCVWWSASGGGGPTLWPEQMERMAKLNLECSFSFADYSENRDFGPERLYNDYNI